MMSVIGPVQSRYDEAVQLLLRSTSSWRVTTYVAKPSAVGQPITPTQLFVLSWYINE